jgi:hypothetical protein
MRVKVLYDTTGQIISLSLIDHNTNGSDSADATLPAMRSGVEAAEGERVAVLDLPEAWHRRRLSDIHRAFIVVQDGEGAQLRPHGRN